MRIRSDSADIYLTCRFSDDVCGSNDCENHETVCWYNELPLHMHIMITLCTLLTVRFGSAIVDVSFDACSDEAPIEASHVTCPHGAFSLFSSASLSNIIMPCWMDPASEALLLICHRSVLVTTLIGCPVG